MVYLDNAATSWPKPESVYQTMDSFLREKGGNPGRSGHSMAVAAEKVIEETRVLLAALFNAPDEKSIIFTLNCTDSLNLALKGLLKPGDHLITDSIGHNSLVRPINRLEREGIVVTRLPPSSEEGAISPFDVERAITAKTRLLAITHASNVSGVIQPVEEIGEVAKRHGVVLLVDAAQSAGAIPIDVQAANIGLLALSGHKGPLGPPGTGVLYVGKDIQLDHIREGGTGTFSESEEQPLDMPQRYESGTPNTVGIAGLGAGVKYVLSQRVEEVRHHELTLIERLFGGLAAIPTVAVYGPRLTSKRVGLVSFRIEGWSPGELGAILDQAFDIKVRPGLHCAPAAHKVLGTYPQGSVRASVGCFNTLDEIDFLVDAIAKIAATGAPRLTPN